MRRRVILNCLTSTAAVLALMVGFTGVASAESRGVPAGAASSGDAPGDSTLPAGSTDSIGNGIETCSAPSADEMNAWQASPYRAIGIHIGGVTRECAQPNLTATWTSRQYAAGWRFMPLYDGPQDAFGQITSPVSQGTDSANDAVAAATSLGFSTGTPIYFVMRPYPRTHSATVLAFLAAWTSRLHQLGYRSAVYGAVSPLITDLVSHYATDPMPDVIAFARWNGADNVTDPQIPATDWACHCRVHQSSGPHVETFDGVSLVINEDYWDVQLASGVFMSKVGEIPMETLGIRFLIDWDGTDGNQYRAGDQAQLPVQTAYDLRSRGVVEPLDGADPLWAQWEGTSGT